MKISTCLSCSQCWKEIGSAYFVFDVIFDSAERTWTPSSTCRCFSPGQQCLTACTNAEQDKTSAFCLSSRGNVTRRQKCAMPSFAGHVGWLGLGLGLGLVVVVAAAVDVVVCCCGASLPNSNFLCVWFVAVRSYDVKSEQKGCNLFCFDGR